MPNTYTLLETITVGAAGASSVTFNSIPQTGYTDLVIKISARSANASNFDNPRISINGSTSTFTRREIYAESGSVGSESVADRIIGAIPAANATSSTFGSLDFYLPNYTSSNYKSYSVDSVTENNSTTQASWLLAGLWSTTTAVSTIAVSLQSGGNFVQYSTFSLYGVSALGVTPTKAPKATGGSIIQTDGTYWYHAFLSSGTFTPATSLSCDVLVVAGGGSGGSGTGGGGGAGGYRSTTALSVSSAITVTVGAGGAGSGTANNGNDSVFSSITSTGGGQGGGNLANGFDGGSGGGSRYNGNGGISSPVTSPVQGYAGGSSTSGTYTPNYGGSGGGGAGGVGGNGTGTTGGNGGAGSNAHSTWLSTVGLGVSGYLAGGGGGGTYGGGTPGSAGSGGAGAGVYTSAANNATANTGSGGGGSGNNGSTNGSGGSGLVIVRYLA